MLDILDNTERGQALDESGNPVPPINNESTWQAMKEGASQTANMFSPMPALNQMFIKDFMPGKVVSPDQVPKDLNFPENSPVTTNEIAYAKSVQSNDKYKQDILNNSPDSWWSKGLVWGSKIAGNLGSPLALGVGVATDGASSFLFRGASEMMIPQGMMDGVSKLTSSVPIAKFGLGAAKTALVTSSTMATLTPFEYSRQLALGQPTDFYGNLKENMIQGLWQGPLFHAAGVGVSGLAKGTVGAFKKWKVGSPQESAEVMNTVQNQVMANKNIDASKVIDQTLYNSSKNISDDDLTTLKDQTNKSEQVIGSLQDSIDSKERPQTPNVTTLGNLNKLMGIIRKNNEDRTPEEQNFRDKLLNIPYYKELTDAQTTPFHERSNNQNELLSNASSLQPEIDSLVDARNESSKLKQKIEDFEQKQSELDPSKRSSDDTIKVAKENKEHYQSLINQYEERLSEIRDLKSNKEAIKSHDEINKLELDKDSLQNISDRNTAAINLKENAKQLTQSELQEQFDTQYNPENDANQSQALHNHYNDEYKNVSREEIPEENEIKEETKDMAPEDRSDIDDEYNNMKSLINNIGNHIKDTIKCIGSSND